MTHFADADTDAGIARQVATFAAATRDLPGERSLANSAATLRHGAAAGVAADWVRAGIMSYGTAKAAVATLSEQLRAETHAKGVKVSVACPSFFKTRLIENFRGADSMRQTATRLMDAATVTAVQPSRSGAPVDPGRAVVSAVVPSSRVVNQRMPTISSTPAITAAMIGTALLPPLRDAP